MIHFFFVLRLIAIGIVQSTKYHFANAPTSLVNAFMLQRVATTAPRRNWFWQCSSPSRTIDKLHQRQLPRAEL